MTRERKERNWRLSVVTCHWIKPVTREIKTKQNFRRLPSTFSQQRERLLSRLGALVIVDSPASALRLRVKFIFFVLYNESNVLQCQGLRKRTCFGVSLSKKTFNPFFTLSPKKCITKTCLVFALRFFLLISYVR